VAVFPIANARPIYRAEPASAPLVLDGSGEGIVAAAAAGMLANNPTIFYAGSFHGSPKLLSETVPAGADLVLTDTNLKELRRWSSVRDNVGETLPAVTEPETPDPTAQPLLVFQHATNSMQTIATYSDAHYIAASSYGNPVAYTPEDRPYMAFDGNPQTAWTASAFSTAGGNWIQVALDNAVTTNYLDLVQPYTQQPNRWITKVTLTFNGDHSIVETLGDTSRQPAGQIIRFPTTTFSTLRITVDATTWHSRNLAGASGVGFAEIGIPGANIFETMQMPSDMLTALGSSSLSHRLTIILTRDRVSAIPPRSDPETFMSRSFSLPTPRTFAVSGTARISALIPDNAIDDILGGTNVFHGAVLGSNERLPGDLNARAVFAFDDNGATFWGPGFDAQAQIGAWMQANLTHGVKFDHLNLQVIADREHSVPTEIRITSNSGENVLVHVPTIHDVDRPGAVASVRLNFKPITGSVLRFTVEAVRKVTTINWYSEKPIVLPFAIAEIGVPGLHFNPEDPAGRIPAVCRNDLMTVDGKPVWLRVSGTVGTAEAGGGLQISGCGPDAGGLHLGPGTHTVVTKWGDITGLDLDRLVFDSAAGGAPLPALVDGNAPPVPGTLASAGVAGLPSPTVTVLHSSSDSAQIRVSGATTPFWLVLGQSVNAGWQASIAGGRSLGGSTLIDGYANGWYISPDGRTIVVNLSFTPQGEVNIALAVSALAILTCVGLGFAPRRRRPRRRKVDQDEEEPKHRRSHARRDRTASAPVTPELDWNSPASLQVPWMSPGAPPSLVAAILAAVASGIFSLLVLPPPWAVPIGAAIALGTFVCGRLGGLRVLFALTVIGGAAAAGILTVTGQAAHHYPPGDAWPPNFETASIVALVAFLALAADAIVEIVRTRPRPNEAGGDEPESTES
jgi:hypothetical protein